MTDSYAPYRVGTSGYGTSGYGTYGQPPAYGAVRVRHRVPPGGRPGAVPPPRRPGGRRRAPPGRCWSRRPPRAVLVLGAAVAATVTVLVLSARADDVGRELGAGIGRRWARRRSSQMDQMMDDFATMDPYASSGGYLSAGPVEQFPPVDPGQLGPDPVLDGYAAECFAGDLQACDDLFFESPPLSAYEEYASTCGGRVKLYTVPFCTELD